MGKLIMVALDPENFADVPFSIDGFKGIEFDFFPEKISTTDRINWNPQDTTTGVKPLFYANREPRKLQFDKLVLDSTDTGESLAEKILQLRKLYEQTKLGVPTKLVIGWGLGRAETVVLEELTIDETFFSTDEEPLRAEVRTSFIEVQDEQNDTTSVRILDET
jgi:Contractile injection system tube protein